MGGIIQVAKEEEWLCCVGCGKRVAKYWPDQTLAISCRCGAGAPILFLEGTETRPSLPFSLLHALQMRELGRSVIPPHLEYYLGHSEHTSPIKRMVIAELRGLGCISENECP